MMTEQSDWDIILKVKRGHAESFSLLVNKYSNRLFQFLSVRLRNKEDIEDVLQESFLKAFQKIDQFNPKYQFSTWMYTIVYNEFCRHLKKNSRLQFLKEDDLDLACATGEKDELDEGNVWVIARQLKPSQFALLWLKYEEELPIHEIALALKMSKVGVKVGLHRARAKMKKHMEDFDQLKKKITVVKDDTNQQALEGTI